MRGHDRWPRRPEDVPPAEIRAATFGAAGEQDFDFAANVARVAGVHHEVVDSSSVTWTTQGLVDSVLAREVPLPHPFGQRYLSYRLHQRIGAQHTFWDWLCGGVVSGGHVPRAEERWTWEAAVSDFLTKHLLPHWDQVPARVHHARTFTGSAVGGQQRQQRHPDW